VNALDRRVKRFRKHVLSFGEPSASCLVISTLKCNNLIFNEIMILNALYVCLTHSRFIENHPIWILECKPLISEMVLSRLPKPKDKKKGKDPLLDGPAYSGHSIPGAPPPYLSLANV
jgi:hypothetical protein